MFLLLFKNKGIKAKLQKNKESPELLLEFHSTAADSKKLKGLFSLQRSHFIEA